jgi:hypothetical protein
MESCYIGGFVERQHEIKSPAWSGKTADGLLASPIDYHKTAKMKTYEDASATPKPRVFLPQWAFSAY